MNIDKIVKVQAVKLRVDHLTGNLSEIECRTFLNNFLKAINNTLCCSGFKCGEERVFGEDKCSEQCSRCKEDYSEDI